MYCREHVHAGVRACGRAGARVLVHACEHLEVEVREGVGLQLVALDARVPRSPTFFFFTIDVALHA